MKIWTLLLFITLLTASCNSILSSKPTGTLSEEQMIGILVDLHLTEATLRLGNDSMLRLNDTTNQRIRFAEVFRKHDILPDNFNTSLNYYIKHIEQLDKIYVEVINQLTEMDAVLQPKSVSVINKRNPVHSSIQNRNPWFRSLNKSWQPEEIQYFDSLKYPVSSFQRQ